MDKIAAYKEAIYKEAMALSRREAARAIYNVSRNTIHAAEKTLPTKSTLNFKRKMHYELLPDQRLIGVKNIPMKDANKSTYATIKLPGQNDTLRRIEVPISDHAISSHEFGHASEYTPSRRDSTLIAPGSHPPSVANKTHDDLFREYIDSAFMDGNKKSKRVGGALQGLWDDAMATGDQKLLEEYYASAKGYNSVLKQYDKKTADNALGTYLTSMLTYSEAEYGTPLFERLSRALHQYGIKNKETGEFKSLLRASAENKSRYSHGGFSEFKDRVQGLEK